MTEDQRDSTGRRCYDDANKALGRHIEANDKRLRRFFIGSIVTLSIIGLAVTISLFGFNSVLHSQARTADQLAILVKQNKQFTVDIQNQRRDSIRDSCMAQNARHDNAVTALLKLTNANQKKAKNKAARNQIRRGRDSTITLLNALAPVENCEQKVKEAVKGG